jgi:hypothetical protein
VETYIVRGARQSEGTALRKFYTTDERDTLPPPSYQSLSDALNKQSLLVAVQSGEFFATAGYFEYLRSNDAHMIYELAGTRVKNGIGRLKEIKLQQVLLALRIVQIIATEEGPVTLISSAKSPTSIENLLALGMQEITPMPEWFKYDTCSWTQMSDRPKWKHFVADARTVDTALWILHQIGFSSGNYVCQTMRKQPDGSIEERPINLIFELQFRTLFPEILAAHRQRAFQTVFVPLPHAL